MISHFLIRIYDCYAWFSQAEDKKKLLVLQMKALKVTKNQSNML